MKTTSFNKTNIRDILDDAEKALAEVAEKHGIKLERKRCSYRADQLPVAFQFLVKELDANGNAMDSRAKNFVRLAGAYGLSGGDYLAEFTSNGRTFRITGLNTRARGYPVLAEEVRTGKTYKFPVGRVKAGLALAKAA